MTTETGSFKLDKGRKEEKDLVLRSHLAPPNNCTNGGERRVWASGHVSVCEGVRHQWMRGHWVLKYVEMSEHDAACTGVYESIMDHVGPAFTVPRCSQLEPVLAALPDACCHFCVADFLPGNLFEFGCWPVASVKMSHRLEMSWILGVQRETQISEVKETIRKCSWLREISHIGYNLRQNCCGSSLSEPSHTSRQRIQACSVILQVQTSCCLKNTLIFCWFSSIFTICGRKAVWYCHWKTSCTSANSASNVQSHGLAFCCDKSWTSAPSSCPLLSPHTLSIFVHCLWAFLSCFSIPDWRLLVRCDMHCICVFTFLVTPPFVSLHCLRPNGEETVWEWFAWELF